MAKIVRRRPASTLLMLLLPCAAVIVASLAFWHGGVFRSLNSANTTQKGLPDSAYHNTWSALPDPSLPTSGPPNICGPWSAANSTEVLAIQAMYGTLDSCLLVDHFWVVTTHTASEPAEIGILNCAPTDGTCMNGWQAKDLTTFAWHTAPPSVTQLKIMLVNGHDLTLVSNLGEWTFAIDTATFTSL